MRILIVEDHADIRRNLEKGLKEEGYFTDSTGDGREAACLMAGREYDAIVLDIMLPGIDGISLVKALRTDGRSTPVLMLTARDALKDKIESLDGGADDFLMKPFEFDELVARLRALIRRSRQVTSTAMAVAGCSVDLTHRTVHRDGEEIVMTRQEFALLELLLQRRGRVVSREFLYERIYEKQYENVSNLLDVLVFKLRSKMGRDVIQTRRGLGYLIPE